MPNKRNNNDETTTNSKKQKMMVDDGEEIVEINENKPENTDKDDVLDVCDDVCEEDDEDDEEEDDEEEDDEEDEDKFNIEEELAALKEKDPEVFEKLQEVKNELERTEPNIKELLTTPMRNEDRAKLCQYYEIYKTHIPNTEEWLESRTRYNYMLKNYKVGYREHSKFTEEEHQKMREEELKLSSYDSELSIKYKILTLNTSMKNKAIIYRRYEELLGLGGHIGDEYSKIKNWLNWATKIPHDNIKQMKVNDVSKFIRDASERLDKELFGMEEVKEQILLFISAKLMNPNMKRSNLGLVGPPGVGKTAIARLIAELMDWGFEQISFGGIDKADFLKGHEYTYVGAQPGAVVKCLKQMGHKNGIIFLDELDKAAEHPDIRAALLHLVDQSQNHDFKDNFLGEVSIDLSKIWYIGSMNKIPEDDALADRWWIIKIDGYTKSEKSEIIEKYLIPKALKNADMAENSIVFDRDVIKYLIDKVCKSGEKGVRTVEKFIADIVNKINFVVVHQDENGVLPFKTTFKVGKKLVYPIHLDKSILDKLTTNKELDTVLNMMYL